MPNHSCPQSPIPRQSYRVQFDGGQNYSLAGIIDRPAHDDDVRATVVFSHCFTCNKDLKAIVKISRSLCALGVAVLRYDMTGLGGSDGDFSETNFTSNMEDLKAAIHFTERELGTVTGLMGHSFGGAATLAILSESLVSSSSNQKAKPVGITLAAPSDTQHLAALLISMNPEIETHGSGMVSIGGREWRITRQMIDDFRSHKLPDRIGRITNPTLLFHSPDDETVSYDHALRIASLLQSSPNNQNPPSLISLLGSDHLLTRTPSAIDWISQSAASFLTRFNE